MVRYLLGVSPSSENLFEAKNWLKAKIPGGVRSVGLEFSGKGDSRFFNELRDYVKRDLSLKVVQLSSSALSEREMALVGGSIIAARARHFLEMSDEEIERHYKKTEGLHAGFSLPESRKENISLLKQSIAEAKSGEDLKAKSAAFSLFHAFFMHNLAKQHDVDAVVVSALKAQHLRKILGREVSCDFECEDEEVQRVVHLDLLARQSYAKFKKGFEPLFKTLAREEEVSTSSVVEKPSNVFMRFLGRLRKLVK